MSGLKSITMIFNGKPSDESFRKFVDIISEDFMSKHKTGDPEIDSLIRMALFCRTINDEEGVEKYSRQIKELANKKYEDG